MRPRGGLTAEIVALVDALGDLVRFVRPPGQRHGVVGVPPLVEGVAFDASIGGKGFDGDGLRAELDRRGAGVAIPPGANREASIARDFAMHRWRHSIESFFCDLKQNRGIATRYGKTDRSFAAFIHLAATRLASR